MGGEGWSGVKFVLRAGSCEVAVRPLIGSELSRAELFATSVYRDQERRLIGEAVSLRLGDTSAAWRGERCVGLVSTWRDDSPLDGVPIDPSWARAGKLLVEPALRRVVFTEQSSGDGPFAPPRSTLASALIGLSAQRAFDLHCRVVALTTVPRLERMYQRLGFERVGEPFIHPTLRGDQTGPHPGHYLLLRVDLEKMATRLKRGSGDDRLNHRLISSYGLPFKEPARAD